MTVIVPPQEDVLLKSYDPRLVRRISGYFKPYLPQLLLSLVLMLANSAAAVAGPYLVERAIDGGMQAGDINALRNIVLLYCVTIVVQWLSIFLRINLMVRMGQAIIYDLRGALFAHLQRLSLSFYSRYSVGRVITRVINDVGVLREFITWTMLGVARDLFTVFGILIAMWTLNWRLSIITFIALPVMIVVTRLFRSRARDNYRKVRAAISWVNSVLAENVNGVRVVQAFSRQPHNYTFFGEQVNRNNLNASVRAAAVAAAFPASIDVLGSISIAVVVWVGGRLALSLDPASVITPGVLVAFVLYIDRFFDPIRDLSQRYDTFQSTMAAGERIFNLLDTPVDVQDAADALTMPPIQGHVRFENVSFQYSDDPTLVLDGIDLDIPAGQTVALVGKTGAGKTTLIKLAARFHDPTAGRVLVDGVDLRTVTQESLRRQMGVVLQDPFLFSGTVAENIRFGRLDADDEAVRRAAEAVGADGFIQKLRYGYDTSVEEGGVVLSVGQRQLISFARALLADPRILILDEATSSIDTQTEVVIQEALKRLLKGRTALVIAHRLSTIVYADQIVVIRDGRVIEQGPHAQLMARHGVYEQLYRSGFED